MDSWDIKQTRALIQKRYGASQLQAARHCLRSVYERLRHARYHFKELRAALKEHIDDQLENRTIYDLTFLPDPETWVDLDYALMKAEAHSFACAQSIHAIGDILAHVVYYGLGMNLEVNPMREREVSLAAIRKKIVARPEYSRVLTELTNLATEKSYVTIDAIVNHGKHRGVVEPRLSIDPPTAHVPYEFEFGAFEYQNVLYAEGEVERVLAPAYVCVSQAVISTGNALNDAISKQTQP